MNNKAEPIKYAELPTEFSYEALEKQPKMTTAELNKLVLEAA